MEPKMKRREFMGTVVGTTLVGTSLAAALAAQDATSGKTPQARASNDDRREMRLERLRPREIDQAMAACPVLFQPLGTIEWHGRHNIAGLDAVKAHHLCVRAAQRGGGLVAPAVFGGVGGIGP